jgi:hypothetical protein
MTSIRTAPSIVAFDVLDSTNAEARRRAEAGEAGPVWITATRQTAGRGRRGRSRLHRLPFQRRHRPDRVDGCRHQRQSRHFPDPQIDHGDHGGHGGD